MDAPRHDAFDLPAIARAEELRQARGLSEVAAEWRPCAGGVAARGEPGEWTNTSVGVGMDGPVDAAEIDDVVGWFSARGVEPRFEVCPFADQSLLDVLGRHRAVPVAFENCFARRLDPGVPVVPYVSVPQGLRVERVDPADDEQVREYARVVCEVFLPEGATITEAQIATSMRVVRHARIRSYRAFIDGRVAGAAACEASDPIDALGGLRVAALFGAVTVPAFRRMGVQQALIAARLNGCAAEGCTFATVGSKPGIATERTAQRMGFSLAYTKVHVAVAGPGLARNRP
jgi:GNAT superfamily N-acetyltransferase